MRKLFRFLKPYKWQALIVVVLTTVQTLSQLYLPTLMADIVNKGVVGQDIALIIQTGLIMLGFTLIVTVSTIVGRLFATRTAVGFARDLRRDIFAKVESYSLREFDKIGTASLVTRSTNDVTQIQNVLVMILSMLLAAPIMAIGGIVMALRTDAGLTWLVGAAIGVMVIVILVIALRVLPLFKSIQKKIDRVNLVLREGLTGIRVIRAFNKNKYETKRFDGANKDLTNTSIAAYRWMGVLMPTIMMLFSVSMVAVVWFGGLRVGAGQTNVGDLMAFQQYVMQVMFAIVMSTMLFVMLPRASASAERVNEILDMDISIVDKTDIIPETTCKGCVEFKDVSFSYFGAQEPAIKGISLTAKPGEVTAIIGGTGSGKSTLVKLIPRFYDVTKGQVLVDGVDVKDFPQLALRERIGYVPQKINLMSGTIAKNVRYGKEDASDEQVREALQTAQASEFVDELLDGIESAVAQGGTNYSGGQKQRLCIARALVRKPEVYIFDDSFSALDFKTDAKLRRAMKGEMKDATVFIVAQRVSTVMNAERIIVLDDGKVVGQGKHKELLKTCTTYKEIVKSQLSLEEMA
ncbi:MAG: ABC transporter ATP-binding protein [Clostridia bacterium]|jgi:ATP-binding cassette, subfamily B, multidrug efflux pump|nr:ABC transporter ATP-binding protein [Clostridia bacterium]MBT7121921.1 ABC transporter ATP-binding protein [Clostridia bacterium]